MKGIEQKRIALQQEETDEATGATHNLVVVCPWIQQKSNNLRNDSLRSKDSAAKG